MKTCKTPLLIGWAQIDITPDRPVFLAGQIYKRVSKYVHDPITATALALENGGDQVVFVSLDTVCVPKLAVSLAKQRLKGLDGLDVEKITCNATHTHNSSGFGREVFEMDQPVGDQTTSVIDRLLPPDIQPAIDIPDNILDGVEAAEYLAEKLETLITEAWTSRAPGAMAAAQDYAAVAFNRRPVFLLEDGTYESKMYGTCSQDNFVGLEGASDHTADMLYTFDEAGHLTGVAVDIPCPSQVMELHYFISADYWTPARRQIRERLGDHLYVLPLCGAAGDQNPLDLIRISKNNVEELREWNAQAGAVFRNLDMGLECEDIGDRIAEAVARGFRKAKNNRNSHAAVEHRVLTLDLPLRQVSRAEFNEAMALIEALRLRFTPDHRMQWSDYVAAFEPLGVATRWYAQQESTIYRCPVHVLRIGDVSIATNPFELFVEFGMRLKARSPSQQTFLIQLSNDNGDYLPTQRAIEGGSYSSKPASTLCGPDSGTELVERTLEALRALWESSSPETRA